MYGLECWQWRRDECLDFGNVLNIKVTAFDAGMNVRCEDERIPLRCLIEMTVGRLKKGQVWGKGGNHFRSFSTLNFTSKWRCQVSRKIKQSRVKR